MPAILAHYLFASKVMPKELSSLASCVYAGTQGPDPFMAYGSNPLHKKADVKAVQPWGGAMHHIHLSEVYLPMIAYARKQEENTQKILFAYIEGLFMHFSLDRAAHPYVFYRTGFSENGAYEGESVFYHGAFEALLDKALSAKYHIKKTPAKALGKLSQEEYEAISKAWASSAKMPLKETAFSESYLEYIGVMKLLYSRTGFLRFLVKKLMGNRSKAYSMMQPAHLKKYEPIDVLNEKKDLWLDPTTLVEHHESVAEIYQEALEAYAKVRPLLARAEAGEDVSKEIDVWENGIDHDGTPYGKKKQKFVNCYTVTGIEP